MKKLLSVLLIGLCVLAVTACSKDEPSDLRKFESALMDVQEAEDHMKETMNHINLNELESLSKTDMADENKKALNQLQDDINNKLMPKFDDYEAAAKQLPADSDEVKDLKSSYLETVDDKRQQLNQLNTFVKLCNQSVKANEDILYYTKLFEKNRSRIEENVKKGQEAGNTEEVARFVQKLEDNNKRLKSTAEATIENKDTEAAQDGISEAVMPLIGQQIRDLNKTNIESVQINDARKNAIEMYYSLQNYYETREETMDISEKLSKIDHHKLPKKGEDLEQYDQAFEDELNEVKSAYQ